MYVCHANVYIYMYTTLLSSVQPTLGVRVSFVILNLLNGIQAYPVSDPYKPEYKPNGDDISLRAGGLAGDTNAWEWFTEWGTIEYGEKPGDLEFRVREVKHKSYSLYRGTKAEKQEYMRDPNKYELFYDCHRFRWSKASERLIDEKMEKENARKFAAGDIARWELKQKDTNAKTQRRG